MNKDLFRVRDAENFIRGYYISERACDGLIEKFETSEQHRGFSGGVNLKVVPEIKDCSELFVNMHDPDVRVQAYLDQLDLVIERYKQEFPYVDSGVDSWSLFENFNLQKYEPGEAYHAWHHETAGMLASFRHLTFMTYLNDVRDGGETDWFHQRLSVKPEKGLTVIWGATWETRHRGRTAVHEPKYIATGWYTFDR